MGKKGLALNDLVSVALAFVLIGITGAIGIYLNTTLNLQIGSPVSAVNFTLSNATSGIANLLSWLPLIAVIVAAGLVISVLVGAFAMRREGV